MEPGTLVADRIEIVEAVARGGMSVVYRARDVHTGRPVALKVASGHRGERLAREAEVLAGIEHPAIVGYVAHGETGDGHFLATEWLDGDTLARRLDDGHPSVADTTQLAARIAGALAAIHERGIVHGDVTPANVVVAAAGAILIDFGLARRTEDCGAEATGGAFGGTPGYLAPEQVRAERAVSDRTDVFALGCVLFECLTGRLPFEGADAKSVMVRTVLADAPRLWSIDESLPADLDALVGRMLARSPAERPAARAVSAELSAVAVAVAGETRSALHLTHEERRAVSLLLVRPGPGATDTLRAEAMAAADRAGAVLETLGDGTMVLCVSELAEATDRAMRAARCALAIRATMPGAAFSIASARTVVSSPAGLGAVIDRSVRDLARATSGAIRLDDTTAALVAARFEIAGPQSGAELLAERAQPIATRTLLGKPTPFVGRRDELARIGALFDSCARDRRPRGVVVTGPAGTGKSRLRQEVVAEIVRRASDVEVWLAQGDPATTGSAFAMLGTALRRAYGFGDADAVDERRTRLTERVARRVDAAEADRVAAFVGEALGLAFPDAEHVVLRAARLEPRLMADQLHRALQDMIAAECRERSLLLVLEDMHWCDGPSLRAIRTALEDHPTGSLFVLGLARPEILERFPDAFARPALAELHLPPLTIESSVELAANVLDGSITPGDAERLAQRAGGNAFCLEELVRAFAERRGEALPESVLAVAQDRLRRVDGGLRRILRAASVFGRTFRADAVAALVGEAGTDTLSAALDTMVAEELLSRDGVSGDGGAYAFRHDLVREAAYSMLTPEDRERCHRGAAEWLARAGDTAAIVLAEHFAAGGAPKLAAPWYVNAAEDALAGGDMPGVNALAERAATCGASGPLLGHARVLEAEAGWMHNDRPASFRAALEAAALLPRGDERWHAALGLVAFGATAVDRAESLVWAAEALLSVEAQPTLGPRRALALTRAAGQLYVAARVDLAAALSDALEAEAATCRGDLIVQSALHRVRSLRGLFGGDPGRYLQEERARADIQRQLGDLRALFVTLPKIGNGLLLLGAYDEAETTMRDAAAAAERAGYVTPAAEARQNLGWALARLGRLDEAHDELARAMGLYAGNLRMEAFAWIYLAAILRRQGKLDEAARLAEDAAARLDKFAPLRAFAFGVLADVKLAAGDAAGALVVARDAMAILEAVGHMDEGEAALRLTHALALDASGSRDAARAAIATARDGLLAQAAKITDDGWRRSFLERVPENVRTLELARDW